MRTRKWSTLLAALVLTTGLSSVVQAADYTQGLTGVVGEDQSLLKGREIPSALTKKVTP